MRTLHGLLATGIIMGMSGCQAPTNGADRPHEIPDEVLVSLGTFHGEITPEGENRTWFEPTEVGRAALERQGVAIESLTSYNGPLTNARGTGAAGQIARATCGTAALSESCDTPYGAAAWLPSGFQTGADCGPIPAGRTACYRGDVELRPFLGREITNLYVRFYNFRNATDTSNIVPAPEMVAYGGAQVPGILSGGEAAGTVLRYGTLEIPPASTNLVDPPHQATVRRWYFAFPAGSGSFPLRYEFQILGTLSVPDAPAPYQASVTGVGDPTAEPVTQGCTTTNGHYTVLASEAALLPGHPAGTSQIYRVRRLTGAVDLISTTAAGGFSAGSARNPCITPDGSHIVFESDATDLVGAGDTNGTTDIFVRDTVASATSLVSRRGESLAASCGRGGGSTHPAISDDGRYVAFSSTCSSLCGGNDEATGCFTGRRQVYRFDTDTATLVGVSVRNGTSGDIGTTTRWGGAGTAWSAGTHNSHLGWISADGARVAFSSTASADGYLAPDATDTATRDVFVRVIDSNTTTRISDNLGGSTGSRNPHISADGLWVAFETASSAIVDSVTDGNDATDIVRCASSGGSCTYVSVAGADVGNGASSRPWLSRDGSLVAFESAATNVVAGDSNGQTDVFVRDVAAGATTLASRNAFGQAGDGPSSRPRFDASGRYVLYQSAANNIELDTAGTFDDDGSASDVFMIRRP